MRRILLLATLLGLTAAVWLDRQASAQVVQSRTSEEPVVELPSGPGARNREALIADPPSKPKLNIAQELGLGGAEGGDGEHVSFSAAFEFQENSRRGTLSLTATIDPGW